MMGAYGCLVTKAIHEKHIWKEYIGVDACAANLMRPAIYGAYHHITVLGKEDAPADHVYDVTGGLCENCDKFAIDRKLPKLDIGDNLVIHDAAEHLIILQIIHTHTSQTATARGILDDRFLSHFYNKAATASQSVKCLERFRKKDVR